MKVPLEWLKEYVTIRVSPKALAERPVFYEKPSCLVRVRGLPA